MNINTLFRAALAALLLCGCSGKNEQSELPEYRTLTVATQDVVVEEVYPASIKGVEDVEIYPQIEGRIVKVCVKEGQTVKAGQPLFVLDKVAYQAALQKARANVEAARADVASATLELQSKQTLFDEKVVSEYDLTAARNSLAVANSRLNQAKAEELDASNSLSYTTVCSPLNGVVGTLPFKTGTMVSPEMNKSLTSVSDNSMMNVYFALSEKELQRFIRKYGSMSAFVKAMPSVELVLSDGDRYSSPGRIETVSGVLNSETGSSQVKAIFPNNNGLLLTGGVGNIVIPHTIENAISIPQSAVYELQDKKFVYKVIEGKAQSTPIEVYPYSDGKTYTVTKGLAAGDIIVTTGVGMIKSGDDITNTKGGAS